MRAAFAVWLFFAVRPGARQGLNTPSLHLLLTIMRQFERNGAYIFIYVCMCSHLPRSLPRIFLSFGSGDCGRTSAYQHTRRRVSGLREDAPWFVCRWLLASVVSLPSFSRAPRFLRFRRDCPRNDFSIVLDSDQRVNRPIVDALIGQEADDRKTLAAVR